MIPFQSKVGATAQALAMQAPWVPGVTFAVEGLSFRSEREIHSPSLMQSLVSAETAHECKLQSWWCGVFSCPLSIWLNPPLNTTQPTEQPPDVNCLCMLLTSVRFKLMLCIPFPVYLFFKERSSYSVTFQQKIVMLQLQHQQSEFHVLYTPECPGRKVKGSKVEKIL